MRRESRNHEAVVQLQNVGQYYNPSGALLIFRKTQTIRFKSWPRSNVNPASTFLTASPAWHRCGTDVCKSSATAAQTLRTAASDDGFDE